MTRDSKPERCPNREYEPVESDIGRRLDNAIEYIRLQGWAPQCSGCRKSIIDDAGLHHSRHVGDSGIVGYSPWCSRCWKKWGRHDDEPEVHHCLPRDAGPAGVARGEL